jgi:hypothetical protein
MVRVQTTSSEERIEVAGLPTVTLTSRTWTATVRLGPAAAGWLYRHPVRVTVSASRGDATAAIIDHVMVVRALAALALLAASTTRRMLR